MPREFHFPPFVCWFTTIGCGGPLLWPLTLIGTAVDRSVCCVHHTSTRYVHACVAFSTGVRQVYVSSPPGLLLKSESAWYGANASDFFHVPVKSTVPGPDAPRTP